MREEQGGAGQQQGEYDVLGEDEGLSADVQDDFRASGLYHLLAVSGQNVAFLAGGIYALGWLLRVNRSRSRARPSWASSR